MRMISNPVISFSKSRLRTAKQLSRIVHQFTAKPPVCVGDTKFNTSVARFCRIADLVIREYKDIKMFPENLSHVASKPNVLWPIFQIYHELELKFNYLFMGLFRSV